MPSTERVTSLKRATAEEKRRAMNERRHEYASKIRKAKKSHLLTMKRRYNAAPTTSDDTPMITTSSLQDLCYNYIQHHTLESLSSLQTALASSDTAVLTLDNTPESMMQLCNTLAYSLRSDASLEERLLASRVLTNLAAMNVSTKSSDDESYYSKQPEGWCQVLIQSQALPALATSLASFAAQVDPSYVTKDDWCAYICISPNLTHSFHTTDTCRRTGRCCNCVNSVVGQWAILPEIPK